VFEEAILAEDVATQLSVIEIWSPIVEHHRIRPKKVLSGVRVTVAVSSVTDYRVELRFQVEQVLRAEGVACSEFTFG
jgi:hypothetical protein